MSAMLFMLQVGYYGQPNGFFYGMPAGTAGSWLLIVLIGVVGWIGAER